MRIKSIAVGLISVAALAFGQVAAAAPSVQFVGGNTKVRLSTELLDALTALGVAPDSVNPGGLIPTEDGATIQYPIPTGELDADGPQLEIFHSGGLTLTAGDTRVALTSFVITNLNSGVLRLTGVVKANDTIVGRIALFRITLTEEPVVTPVSGDTAGQIVIRKAEVTLTKQAADALNGAFGLEGVFTGGFPIGTARVVARFRDYDGG